MDWATLFSWGSFFTNFGRIPLFIATALVVLGLGALVKVVLKRGEGEE